MRTKGKLTTWHDAKGYGFITPSGGGARVFVHVNAFLNLSRRPQLGEVVTYALGNDERGRPRALQATLAGERLGKTTNRRWRATIGGVVFLGIVGAAVVAGSLPPAVFGLYLVASVITFVAYALDKSAARKGAWRTAESTLHFLALVGGWPGALAAREKLRHKSQKYPFRLVFWLTVALNCAAFAWLFTPTGAAIVNSRLAG